MAIVEFEHDRGRSLGEPYGKCSQDCAWTVVKFVMDRALTAAELATYGLTAKTRRF